MTALLELDISKIALIKRTIAKGASDDELALFLEQCRRTGLDPFARQIYSVRRKQWDSASRSYVEVQVIQVSIDGFRLIADRSNRYAGQVGPWWTEDGIKWHEVWLSDSPPRAAKMGVLRHDFTQPLYAVALYKSYVQTNRDGEPTNRWKTDPAGMLAKCAEALALRRAFPNDLSGLYTSEEMENLDEPPAFDIEQEAIEATPRPALPLPAEKEAPAEAPASDDETAHAMDQAITNHQAELEAEKEDYPFTFTSEGVPYDALENEEISHHLNSLLKHKKPTDEQAAKINYLKHLLKERNSKK